MNSVRSALIWNALRLRDWYKVTVMKWLVWSAVVCSALVRSDWFDSGMKWLRYEVLGMRWLWYEMTSVWSDFGMKCTDMKWPWYEVHWYEVTIDMKWLVWSGLGMKWPWYEVTFIWSAAWYVVHLYEVPGMKWQFFPLGWSDAKNEVPDGWSDWEPNLIL